MGLASKWMQIMNLQLCGNHFEAGHNSGAIVFLYELHILPIAKSESMLTASEGIMEWLDMNLWV